MTERFLSEEAREGIQINAIKEQTKALKRWQRSLRFRQSTIMQEILHLMFIVSICILTTRKKGIQLCCHQNYRHTKILQEYKKGRNMSNNYYAGNVIYNNQHKELTIQGNLSAQQMMKIAKDFC